MRVRFCGVRGSTPAPGIEFVRYGGHTSCLTLAHDDAAAPSLILDAGNGLQCVSGLLDGEPFVGTILLTHLHWDHVLGLPFFAAADRRDARLHVVLPEQDSGKDAESVLAGMMSPPYFPVGPSELRGHWTFATIGAGEHQLEGFTVLAREIPHKGGRTFGYRISDGHSTLTYMPDHCPTMFGPGEDGFGEYHAAALELASDADVLVHDAQLFPRSSPPKPTSGTPSPTTPSSWRAAPGRASSRSFTTATTAPTTTSTASPGGSEATHPASRSPPRKRSWR